MDFNSLKDAAANLSLYDLKASVRKVQNGRAIPLPVVHMLTRTSRHELYGDGGESQRGYK